MHFLRRGSDILTTEHIAYMWFPVTLCAQPYKRGYDDYFISRREIISTDARIFNSQLQAMQGIWRPLARCELSG